MFLYKLELIYYSFFKFIIKIYNKKKEKKEILYTDLDFGGIFYYIKNKAV